MKDDELNTCDKCGVEKSTYTLVWIDAEDFVPKMEDEYNQKKCLEAIKKKYSALCLECYFEDVATE